MVRHDNPFIQLDIREMAGDFQPALFCDSAYRLISEEKHLVVCADGDEIGACLRIVVVLQAEGAAVGPLLVICHFIYYWHRPSNPSGAFASAFG